MLHNQYLREIFLCVSFNGCGCMRHKSVQFEQHTLGGDSCSKGFSFFLPMKMTMESLRCVSGDCLTPVFVSVISNVGPSASTAPSKKKQPKKHIMYLRFAQNMSSL